MEKEKKERYQEYIDGLQEVIDTFCCLQPDKDFDEDILKSIRIVNEVKH